MDLLTVIFGLLTVCAQSGLQAERPLRMPYADEPAAIATDAVQEASGMSNTACTEPMSAPVSENACGSIEDACTPRSADGPLFEQADFHSGDLWMPYAEGITANEYLPCCRERLPCCSACRSSHGQHELVCPGPQTAAQMPRADEIVIVPFYLPCPRHLQADANDTPPSMPRTDDAELDHCGGHEVAVPHLRSTMPRVVEEEGIADIREMPFEVQ